MQRGQRAATNIGFAGEMQDRAAALPRSPGAQRYAQILDEAPDSFKGFLSTITGDPIGFMAWAGETLAESGPSIGAGIVTSATTGNPALGAGVMSMGGFNREYSNEVNRFLGEKGIDLSNPNAVRALLSNPQAMHEANQRGVMRGLVVGMFEAAGQGAVASKLFGKTISRRTGSQMATEGGGEAAATAAVGDDISIKEALAEGVVGGASVAPESIVAGRSVFNRDGTVVDPQTLDNRSQQIATETAIDLRNVASENGYNLKDVNPSSGSGAKMALEGLRSRINGRIATLSGELESKLGKENAQSLNELLEIFTPANEATKDAKSKVSTKVTQEQFKAVEQLAGQYQEGQMLLNEMAKPTLLLTYSKVD